MSPIGLRRTDFKIAAIRDFAEQEAMAAILKSVRLSLQEINP
jgi:hypothetical protein